MAVRLISLFLLLAGTVLFTTAQAPDRQLAREQKDSKIRTALVIGNSDYVIARKLSNPSNDATDMARTLADLGFEVVFGTNLSLKEMTEKVREFGDKLKVKGGVGLFYYAGHGVQVGGRNYLVPVEADIPREDEIDFNAFNVDIVFRKMASANNGLNIVVLDACRNNPFARSWSRGDEEGGLAQINAPTGTFIAYATSPDRTASDGPDRNGLYTAELLRVLKQPNIKIEEAFKQVTIAVDRASKGQQIPWTSSSLRGEFYFNVDGKDYKATFTGTVTPVDPSGRPGPISTSGAATSELDAWNKIKSSSDSQDFAKFLNAFPNGIFAGQAKDKLIALTGGVPTQTHPGGNTALTDFYSNLLGGGAASTPVFYLDGESRVQMKIAPKKQDYSGGAGVMGIGGGFKMLDTLNNGRAPLRVSSSPVFEFQGAANVNPNDIAFVVRLRSKGDRREIQNMQRTFSGYKKEDMVPVVYEEVSSAGADKKIYRIKFSQALAAGEYAVVIRQTFGSTVGIDSGANLPGTFFDFGVDR